MTRKIAAEEGSTIEPERESGIRGAVVADEQIDDANESTPESKPEEHHLKDEMRSAVAKVVGIAAEAGSMLSGHSGEMVSAERTVAEADAEKFIDRIDGEG
jgi:hypothetical protein